MASHPSSSAETTPDLLGDPAFLPQLPLAGFEVQGLPPLEPDDTEHGAVFTRRWVVELILDLAGYTADKDLAEMVAIEPACGDGAFLAPMVERLSESCRRHGREIHEARGAIRAYDLQAHSVSASQLAVAKALRQANWKATSVEQLTAAWISHADFLLNDHPQADFVLGNPPYVRLEAVPSARSSAYRRTCQTMGGRADLFVGFYEIGLKTLKPDGALAFICADRWMRNQYGRLLRKLVSEHFSFEAAIEMHDVDAFAEEVSAYPSITVIRRRPQQTALVVETTKPFGEPAATALGAWAANGAKRPLRTSSFRAASLSGWFDGQGSWPAGSPARLALLQELEERLPPLEDSTTGTRVGIGVATGADKVFVTNDTSVAERDRLLPMAMAFDTMSGELEWSGHYLVDPWSKDGSGLVDLADFPQLDAYYETNADSLRRRNVAGRRPAQWFRTIDRVDHSLTPRDKLLFPDIKAAIHPVLDRGKYYPHHNLYFVVSEKWDLEVLGGLLLSRVAQLFIESYAVRMRGGYLRFQAQYLRRIRVPSIEKVTRAQAERLRQAFRARDVDLATTCALELYEVPEIPE